MTLDQGATLSQTGTGAVVTDNHDGSFTLTAASVADLAGLTITPASEFEGTVSVGVSAVAHDGTAVSAAGTTSTTLTVNPVAEGPVFSGSVATSAAEQGGLVTLAATVAVSDGDDTLGNVTITGLAHDLTSFNGGTYTAATGTWSGTAAQFNALTFHAGEDGVQNLTVTASTTGAEAGSNSESYTLTVNPVAEGPVFSGSVATSAAEQGGLVTLAATVAVSDGDDTLGNVTITGLAHDLTSFNGGTYTAAPGPGAGRRRSSTR